MIEIKWMQKHERGVNDIWDAQRPSQANWIITQELSKSLFLEKGRIGLKELMEKILI